MWALKMRTAVLLLAVILTSAQAARLQRPRQGRFIGAHFDMLQAASSLFPNFQIKEAEDRSDTEDSGELEDSTADKLIGAREQIEESDTIRDMGDSIDDLQDFGAKLQETQETEELEEMEELLKEVEEEIEKEEMEMERETEQEEQEQEQEKEENNEALGVQGREAEVWGGGKRFNRIKAKGGYGKQPPPPPPPAYGSPPVGPQGEVEPYVVICEDPNYCPPPPGYGYPRVPYGSPYGGIKDYGSKYGTTPPTYSGEEQTTERPKIKKYGYNPSKSNPTIWRQQIKKSRVPHKSTTPKPVEAPAANLGEEDINSMSMEQLRDFIKSGMMTTEEPFTEEVVGTVPGPETNEKLTVQEEEEMKEMKMKKMVEKMEQEGVQKKIQEMKSKKEDIMMLAEMHLAQPMMVPKEVMVMKAGLPMQEAKMLNDGISVEELIGMKNDMSVEEMIAMKNQMPVVEVLVMKEMMEVEEILEEHQELELEEVVALKNDLTIEEMVAMKNDVSVEEIVEIEKEIEMEDIMSLEQEGLSKEEVMLVVDDIVPLKDVVENQPLQLGGGGGEGGEPVMGMQGLKDMAQQMEVIDINGNTNPGAQFVEVFSNPAFMRPRPTPTPTTTTTTTRRTTTTTTATTTPLTIESHRDSMIKQMMERMKKKEDMKKKRIKMRPMRVKVRKPTRPQSFARPDQIRPELDFETIDVEDMVDQAFGLKNTEDLVLDPTPAVPGRPVISVPVLPPPPPPLPVATPGPIRTRFQNFPMRRPMGPTDRPSPPTNLMTEDFQSENAEENIDYDIYDVDFESMTQRQKPREQQNVINIQNTGVFMNVNEQKELMQEMKQQEFLKEQQFMSTPTAAPTFMRDTGSEFMTPHQFNMMNQLKAQGMENLDEGKVFMHSSLMENQGLKNGNKDDAMPIFSNFPMMKPGELIQLGSDEESADIEDYDPLPDYSERPEILEPVRNPAPAFQEPVLPEITPDITQRPTPITFFKDRPESIELQAAPATPAAPAQDDLQQFVNLFSEEQRLSEEDRPVRRPKPFVDLGSEEADPYHPNHKYPRFPRPTPPSAVRGTPTPFTARPKITVVPYSFARNRFQKKTNQPTGFFSNPFAYEAVTSRELPEHNVFKKEIHLQPFIDLGKEYQTPGVEEATVPVNPEIIKTNVEAEDKKKNPDKTSGDMKGVTFFNNYGQHDDRPSIRRPTLSPAKEAEKTVVTKRPGEIRYGGMSFVPPPGKYSDRPLTKKVKKKRRKPVDRRPVSDVYPDHPASAIFPNSAVSDIFVDFPTSFQAPDFSSFSGPGISIEEPVREQKKPAYNNFFKEPESSYIENPFGNEFIKLEIDQSRFNTNKTKPTVHHIPLDVHGYPDVPNYQPEQDVPQRPKRKLYRPPPVMTEYTPPQYNKNPEAGEATPSRDIVSERQQKQQASGDNGFPFSVMKEAMTKLPSTIQNLPVFMEKLMGNHASWARRAWQGSRDEAAARSFDSISSDDFDNDDFGDEFASLFDTVEDTSDDEYEY